MRPTALLLLVLAACPPPAPVPIDAGFSSTSAPGASTSTTSAGTGSASGATSSSFSPPAAAPCTPSQCQAIHKASGGYCGPGAPYGCTVTGGCYPTPAAADAGCYGDWCSTLACSAIPQPQRPARNVVFSNRCAEKLSIWLTDPSPGSNPHPYCSPGVANCLLFSVDAGASATFSAGLVYNDAGGYYGMPAGGIALWAMPTDGDTADTTLFEINFGAFGGTADSYDISAIPPGSCSGHVQSPSNDLGYADHLPRKSATNPAQSWACLKLADGGPNPATCGDGLGRLLCPKIVSDAGFGTIKPLPAVKGQTASGCGVPGETCYYGDGGFSDGGCCPDICAVTQSQDPLDSYVRTQIYECAHAQALLTGPGRRTGYWKSMRVDPTVDAGCRTLICMVPDGGNVTGIGRSCKGYLWPYDDLEAAAVCEATPDYQVTFCP